MKYDVSRRAEQALREIFAYTFLNFAEAQVDQYLASLDATFSLLAENPRMGRQWRGEFRRFPGRDYWIYYRILSANVFITDIRSARLKPPDDEA